MRNTGDIVSLISRDFTSSSAQILQTYDQFKHFKCYTYKTNYAQ